MVVVAVVGVQLLIGKVETGEELVLLNNEIGDHGLLRPGTKIERLQQLEPLHEKGKLRLKGRPALAFVERAQKRIGFGFHHPLRAETLSQEARQRALAHSYGTFHS